VTSVVYPDASRNLGFVYDSAPAECPATERFHVGRLARMTDASGATAFCYDRFGHLTRKLQATQGRTFAVRYDYTPRAGSGNGVLLRPRPPAGHLMGLTYPDGAQVRIDRNQLREITGLTVTLADGRTETLLRNAQYYPFGPASRWTYGNGRTLARSLNQNYLPGFVEDTRPAGLSEGYWFDAVGNLQSLQRADQSAPSKRLYDYDGLDRLTSMRDGASDALLQGYAYDKTGNRTRETEGSAVRDYAYVADTHRLASAAGLSRQYDAAGNTTRIGPTTTAARMTTPVASGARAKPTRSWRLDLQAQARARRGAKDDRAQQSFRTAPLSSRAAGEGSAVARTGGPATKTLPPHIVRDFLYDATGRMRQVRHDGVVAMDYLYNARGERVHRSGSGQSVTTVYDEAGRWLGDYDASGQPIQQAIWLDDLPVGLLVGAGANQTLYYLQPDALGSPRVAIDPVRDVAVWRWDLSGEAFGETPPNEDPDGDGTAFLLDMRFPGQRHDAATGLYHNYFRDYDPTIGRYVQSDPIGLVGGINTYAYGNGAPLGFSDPLGLRGNPLGDMFGRMIARPIVQRMGGGLLARGASAAAKARAQARRAAELAQRMQGIWGRIARGGKRGADEVPQGCDYVRVSKADPAADAIAQRLGGVSRVRFPGRFKDREFDFFSDQFIGQTKPANFELGSSFRNQAKATFEAAIELKRKPYFHFDGPPNPAVISKLAEYAKRYSIDPIIDTTPL
jgi:RHS repeat-associated protein